MGFVVVSELCRVSMGIVTGMGVSLGLTVPTIMGRGTLAQQERWLPDLVTYDKIGAWAITEPDSGSDAFGGMKSYVVRDGDDYILNGQKTFITNGPGRRRHGGVRRSSTRATPVRRPSATARC